MALQKIDIPISFGQGPDTKTDPKQVVAGRLLYLQNSRYKTLNSFIKRNGYGALSLNILGGGSISNGIGLASFQNQLNLYDGSSFYAFSESVSEWSNKGPLTTANFTTYPVIKNTNNQNSQDSTYHSSGVSLYAWEDSSGGIRYSIVDSITGQQIVDSGVVSSTGSIPRLCTLGTYVLIFYVDSGQIQYKSINVTTPNSISGATAVTSDLNTINQVFDVVTVNSKAFVVYTDTSPAIAFYSFTTLLVQSSQYTVGSDSASCISAYGDASNNIWASYYNGTDVVTLIVNNALNSTVLSPTTVETVSNIRNVAGATLSTTGTVFYEVSAPIAFNNNIRINTITSGGTPGTPSVLKRSLGLASKAFVYNSKIYINGAYPSTLEGKYFLLDNSGQIISRFGGEPQLGGGLTAKSILPSINKLTTDTFQFSYLQVDIISFSQSGSSSTVQETASVQTGVMQGEILFNTGTSYSSLSLGNNLNLTGALPTVYDGNNLVEQGFNIYPENLIAQPMSMDGALSNGQYQYCFVYEWTDLSGQKHQSSPSAPVTANVQGIILLGGASTASSNNTTPVTQIIAESVIGVQSDGIYPLASGWGVIGSAYTWPLNNSNITTVTISGNSSTVAAASASQDATDTSVVPQFITGMIISSNPNVIQVSSTTVLWKQAFLTSGSPTFTLPNVNGLVVGMLITANNTTAIPSSTTISAINGNVITMSNNAGYTGLTAFAIKYQITTTASMGSSTFTVTSGQAATLQVGQMISISEEIYYITNISGTTITLNTTIGTSGTDVYAGFYPSQFIFPGQIINNLLSTPFIMQANTTIIGPYTDPTGLNVPNAPYYQLYSIDLPINPTGANESIVVTNQGAVQLTIPTLRVTDRTNVSIAVYRTEANGTIFYRVSPPQSSLANDPTIDSVTFIDVISDESLINNQQLYTTGGEVPDIALPPSNLTTIYNNRQISVPVENPLSFWYSKQVIPGYPVEFSDQFINNIDQRGGDITAIGVMDDKLIMFKPNNIFYLVAQGPAPNGTNNDFNSGTLIISPVGCVNQKSIVQMPNGLMFQASSNNGIYLLTRDLEVVYIGADVEAYNSYTVTSTQLIPTANEVRFTLSNGTVLVFDYFVSKWDIDTSLSAVDSCLFQNKFTFLNSNGTVYQETPGTYTDNGSAINIGLTSSWLSFAGLQGFQRVYELDLLGQWYSTHNLIVQFAYNFNNTIVQTETIPVNSDPNPYQFRVFFNNQKCESVQITITEQQTGTFGQGLSLSGLNFIVGKKKGHYKLPAAASYG